tara:strand:- start:1631 stop:1867 length:237 start_codon:yes stop_codon:yes gene_type:complete
VTAAARSKIVMLQDWEDNLIADRGVTAQDPMVCGVRSESSVRYALQNQGIMTWINDESSARKFVASQRSVPASILFVD